jgi:NAD(P)-dependent dehydrogenase (short-subunit alcohol dehydrogenase family)
VSEANEAQMGGICEGRVVIVTGAGRGIGREHALEFARQGARVVVNDLGVAPDGSAPDPRPAEDVAGQCRELGAEAVASADDVADWEGSARLVRSALERFGGLDVIVNNAGSVRDRTFVNLSEEEWDSVVRSHLKGHFCVARHAAAYWRAESKAGRPRDARIINTSSGAGLQGSRGQAAYSAAKAGIAVLTLVQAVDLAGYGVTANGIAPSARTRLTEIGFPELVARPERGFDALHPENVAPVVVWLGSAESRDVTGRIFELRGGRIALADGWRSGPVAERGERWKPSDVGPAVRDLIARAAPPQKVYGT